MRCRGEGRVTEERGGDAEGAVNTPSLRSETQALETSVRELLARAPARKRLRQYGIAICLSTLAVAGASGLMTVATGGSPAWATLGQTAAMAAGTAAAGFALVIRRQLRDPRMRQLEALDDVRGVGPLLDLMDSAQEMWEYDDPSRRVIKAALIRLLPKLQASDTEWLTPAQRESLVRALYFCTHPGYPWHFQADFAVTLLKALEQVGDGRAEEYVQTLAYQQARGADRLRIQEAARACLPFLQERARQQQALETLLRASQPTVDPDMLVRPMGAFEPRDPTG
jgi:hypothetical protein